MKNKLKFLALLLIVPVLFVFTACGGQLGTEAKVNIGKKGDYTETTYDELNNYLVENVYKDEVAEATNGMLFRITMNMTSNMGAMSEIKAKVNAIVGHEKQEGDTAEELYNYVMASKLKVSGKVKYNNNTENYDASAEIYVKDGFMYVNAKGSGEFADISGKTKYSANEENEFSKYLSYISVDPVELMMQLQSVGATAQVSVNTKDGLIRYCIETSSENVIEESDLPQRIYLVFKDNNLIQIQTESEMSFFGMEMNVVIKMEVYNGNIEFPDFKDYVDQSAAK